MFKKLRPYASSKQLLAKGTDFTFDTRFRDTLAYNHFSQKDHARLQEVADILKPALEEATDLVAGYLQELVQEGAEPLSREEIKVYLQLFLNEQKNEEYVHKIISFFNTLRLRRYNIGKLIVVFNQLNFFFIVYLLSKKVLQPQHCLRLMESLQRATNIEQQVLIEVYTEKLVEQVAEGISALMDKNAEIMFIKDLLQKLEIQNDEAQNITAATQQMTASVAEVANHAVEVAEQTEQAVHKAEQGKVVITEALGKIVRTDQTFDEIVSNFAKLQENIDTIQNVVALINQIADQTNLLALNASIEAARAGEQGRGFAVVASEVRKLAEHTVHSLTEINENVDRLKTFSKEVSTSIHSTSAIIKEGVQEASEAVPTLDEIVTVVENINLATNNTAATAEEQAAAVDDIANRMVSITELTEEAKALGEQTGQGVHSLSKISEAFRTEIFANNIKLSTRALLELAKTDHILWKWKVYNMLLGLERLNVDDVSSHRECRLGLWYFDASSKKRVGHLNAYTNIDRPHQQVHDHARLAVEAYHQGNLQQAEEHLLLLDQASVQVITYLNELIGSLDQ